MNTFGVGVDVVSKNKREEEKDFLGGLFMNEIHRKDKWRWELGEDGELMVKELARLTEEKMLRVEGGDQRRFEII
ncbi:hypothetical protein Tco_1224676, partial [Tanacetum coccineum]